MRKLIPVLLIFGLLFSFSLAVFADRPPISPPPKRYDPPSRSYTPEKSPAVWLLYAEHDEVQTNSIKYTIHRKMKINSEKGTQRYLDYTIHYSSSTDKLTIHHAKVIKPSGKVLKPSEDAVVDISVSSRRMYSDARKRVFHWPGLTPGSVIDIKYTIESEFPIEGEYFSYFRFQDWMPIKKAEFSIEVPENHMLYRDFQVSQSNGIGELPLKFSSKGNIYRWKLTKVPGIQREMGMPSLFSVAPSIRVTSLMRWTEVSNWWWPKVHKMMEDLDKKIIFQAMKVTRYAETDRQKVMALYHWIEQKISYVALEFGEGGRIPYAPNKVFKRGIGDCKDGAVLLAAIGQALDLEIYPALINTQGGTQPGTPTLSFNHAVAVLKTDKRKAGSKWRILDTTTQFNKFGNAPIGDQNRWLFVMGVGNDNYELVQSPLFSPEKNLWRKDRVIKLKEDGTFEGSITWTLKGAYGSYFRYVGAALSPSQLMGYFESYVNRIAPGAHIKKKDGRYMFKMSNPTRLHYPVRTKDGIKLKKAPPFRISFAFEGRIGFRDGKKMVFNVPSPDPLKGLIKKKWRYFPFIYNFPHKELENTKIIYPVNYKLSYHPNDWGKGGYWGWMKIKYNQKKQFMKSIKRTAIKVFKKRWLPRRLYNGYVESTNQFALRIELPLTVRRVR